MKDLFAKSELRYTGPASGVVFVYSPPGAHVKNEITGMLTENGVPDDVESESAKHLVEMRMIMLRCCLKSLEVDGEVVPLSMEPAVIGGFPCQTVTKETLGQLAEGMAGADLIEFADYAMASMNATSDEKNASAGQ